MVSGTQTPLISVIMPAYNAQTYIGASITGVLAQTYPNVELLVVDDGSSDRTREICEGYGPLIRYIYKENGGSASARNVGLREARGEFIALCDSDDIFAPSYLEEMLNTYRTKGGGRRLVMSNATIYTSTGVSHGRELIGSRYYPYAKQRMAMLQQNFIPYLTLFPREMADELGGFEESVPFNEDWDFFLRAVFAGWLVDYQRVPLAEYRWTPGAKSTNDERANRAFQQILGRAGTLPGLTPEEREHIERSKGGRGPRRLDISATQALREGRYAEARDLFSEVVASKPLDRRQYVRAQVFAKVPVVMRFWRLYLGSQDGKLGRKKGEVR